MKAIFSYYAKKEFEDAFDYYKIQSPGLEDRFKEEVKWIYRMFESIRNKY